MIKQEFVKAMFAQKVTLENFANFISIDFRTARTNVFSAEVEKMIDPEPFEFSTYNMYYSIESNSIIVNYSHGNLIKKKEIKL